MLLQAVLKCARTVSHAGLPRLLSAAQGAAAGVGNSLCICVFMCKLPTSVFVCQPLWVCVFVAFHLCVETSKLRSRFCLECNPLGPPASMPRPHSAPAPHCLPLLSPLPCLGTAPLVGIN